MVRSFTVQKSLVRNTFQLFTGRLSHLVIARRVLVVPRAKVVADFVGEGHDGVLLGGLDAVVQERDEPGVVPAKVFFYIFLFA